MSYSAGHYLALSFTGKSGESMKCPKYVNTEKFKFFAQWVLSSDLIMEPTNIVISVLKLIRVFLLST